ncbi:MAG: universal stress protein [Frankia sp.]
MSELVVGIDGSPGSGMALEWAVHEARLRRVSVRAVLTWAAEGHPSRSDTAGGQAKFDTETAANHLLHATVSPIAARNPDVKIHERLVRGPPVAGLVKDAEYAAMLVIGARGLGPLHRLLVGSVSAGCTRKADAPVVVVRSPVVGFAASAYPTPGASAMGWGPGDWRPGDWGAGERRAGEGGAGAVPPIVVGIDGSGASLVALAWAAEEAALRGAALRVIHAWALPARAYGSGYHGPPRHEVEKAGQSVLDHAVSETLGTDPIIAVNSRLIAGRAPHILVEAAAGAALLVVGARGHGGFAGLTMGSTSHECVVHAPGPVAVIR